MRGKSVPLFDLMCAGGTILGLNPLKSNNEKMKWQPVGESNPSFQVENLAS